MKKLYFLAIITVLLLTNNVFSEVKIYINDSLKYYEVVSNETISYTQLVNKIEQVSKVNSKSKSLVFDNIDLFLSDSFDENKVKIVRADTIFEFLADGSLVEIVESIVALKNINFDGTIKIVASNFWELFFEDCDIKNFISEDCNVSYTFTNCLIDKLDVQSKDDYVLRVNNSKVRDIKAYSKKRLITSLVTSEFDEANLCGQEQMIIEIDSVNVRNGLQSVVKGQSQNWRCEIKDSKGISVFPNRYYNFKYGNIPTSIDNFIVERSELDTLNLANTIFKGSLIIDSSKVFDELVITNMSITTNQFNLNWINLNDNIITVEKVNLVFAENGAPMYDEWGMQMQTVERYKCKDSVAIKDLTSHSQLMAQYNMLYHIFKERGDIKSANGSYKEMKNYETSRLEYIYKAAGGVENYLNWQLNVFLNFFAEYGTSPIRSLVVSFWVVLAFAVFYFFTRTDWDNINRKYLVKQSEQIMDYFTSEQKLEDFYSETYKEEIVEYNEFKKKIAANSTQIPFFFMFFLKPLYYLSVVKHRLNSWLYKKMEILSGRWIDLPSNKKMVVGSIVAVASFSYLLYLFVVRSLNSIILSINTFSTLGFGDIPVRGFMRYVAIIEGFLGWFLLSIFSVSLISQILQS